jgi:HAD superfamily hydrolase (TIGR01509 family)
MNFEKIKVAEALIFDCDGTLADTMICHCKAYEETFKQYKIPFSESEFYKHAQLGGKHLLQKMITEKNIQVNIESIANTKSQIIDIFLKKYMIPNNELIQLIKENHIKKKIAVVSNGRRKSISKIIENLQIDNFIDVLLTAEDFNNLKPDPEPYLKVLQKMNIKPEKVVVFEDNEVGFQSASKAGCYVEMVKIKNERG